MPKISPWVILAGAGAAAFAFLRPGRAKAEAPPEEEKEIPSTQAEEKTGTEGAGGVFVVDPFLSVTPSGGRGIISLGGSEGYVPSEFGTSIRPECYRPPYYGYVQGAYPAERSGRRPGGSTQPIRRGKPPTWAAGHNTPLGSYAGLSWRRDRNIVPQSVNAGDIVSERSLRQYWGLSYSTAGSGEPGPAGSTVLEIGESDRRYDKGLNGWAPIPAGVQSIIYDDFVRAPSGDRPFTVPDTELNEAQFLMREESGVLSSNYGRGRVEKVEGFHATNPEGRNEMWVRVSQSRNWSDISDQDSDLIYFASASGFVALHKPTMTNAINRMNPRPPDHQFYKALSPRWKTLRYGAVPSASTPWEIEPFLSTNGSEISGGNRNRDWEWRTGGPRIILEGQRAVADAPAPYSNWTRATGPVTDYPAIMASYPRGSSFKGSGHAIYSKVGCRDRTCHLTTINAGSIMMGGNGAPFDFAAPVYLHRFVIEKMRNYASWLRFSGDV